MTGIRVEEDGRLETLRALAAALEFLASIAVASAVRGRFKLGETSEPSADWNNGEEGAGIIVLTDVGDMMEGSGEE